MNVEASKGIAEPLQSQSGLRLHPCRIHVLAEDVEPFASS